MTTTASPKLFEALAKAQKSAKAVEHDAKNSFHKYAYTSAEAIIAEHHLLSEQGLSLVPLLEYPEQIGDTAWLCTSWLLCHASGESLTMTRKWPIVPDRGRPIDKACASADTTSLSYLLRDLLLMPRVEQGTDMNDDSRDRGRQRDDDEPPEDRVPINRVANGHTANGTKPAPQQGATGLSKEEAAAAFDALKKRYAETFGVMEEEMLGPDPSKFLAEIPEEVRIAKLPASAVQPMTDFCKFLWIGTKGRFCEVEADFNAQAQRITQSGLSPMYQGKLREAMNKQHELASSKP